jgi:hypothetical protein
MRRKFGSSLVNNQDTGSPMLRAVIAIIAFAAVVAVAHLLESPQTAGSLSAAAFILN